MTKPHRVKELLRTRSLRLIEESQIARLGRIKAQSCLIVRQFVQI